MVPRVHGPRQLRHHDVEVPVEDAKHRGGMPYESGEIRPGHAQGRARALDDGSHGRGVDAQLECCSQHPLVTHEAHFQGLVAVQGGHQRDEPGEREVHILDRLVDLRQSVAEYEVDRLAFRQQPGSIFRGNARDQFVRDARRFDD